MKARGISITSTLLCAIALAAAPAGAQLSPDKKFPPQETQFILDGRWDVSDVEDEAFKEFRRKHGLAN